MARYKLIFTTVFLILFSIAVNAQGRLTLTWEVTKYDIEATLPQNYSADRDLDVKATLNLKNIGSKGASTASMRISDKAKVSSVLVNGSTGDFTSREETIGGNRNLQKVVIRVPSVDKSGNVSITVNYKLNVKANSGLNALSPAGSQFLPLSHWYPTPTSWYFTGGADYAPINLKVNSTDGQTVIASGIKTINGFEQKLNGQPFFTTGQWDTVNANGVEIFVPKGITASAAVTNELGSIAFEAKNYVSALLGKSFDTPIRIVGVSRGSGFSDSGIIFVDESLFNRQKVDSQTAMSISEGIIKTWLGNLVKVEGDGYGVIREGLARYIATEFIGKKYGKESADLERLRQRTNYSAISQRDDPLKAISPIDSYYYTASANKGAMIWNFLYLSFGDELFKLLQADAADGDITLDEVRATFSAQKEYLDYVIDRVTEMNLMIGLPQPNGNQYKVALRNLSEIDVNIDVQAIMSNGQKLNNKVLIKANKFGETIFNTPNKIVTVEIDADKIYPQTDYSDDVAPREIGDNDALVFIKKEFNRQKFADAEKNAKTVLNLYPNFDDAKILLARSQLAAGKTSAAQKNFQDVLSLKLPSAQSLAWANVGLGEVASNAGQNSQAKQFFDEAIKIDADLGASLTARRNRSKLGSASDINADVKAFFDTFDKAVSSNTKSAIDGMIVNGEIARFGSSVAGQAQEWATQILHVDKIDANSLLVEANMSVKLFNRNNETGLAVYRLTRVGNEWKLSAVEIFEVG